MRYNFDRLLNRRLPGVVKWTKYPKDVLPMWVADMDFSAPPAILNALDRFLKHGDLGYQTAAGPLYEAIVARMESLYKWKITPEMIVPVAGVNSGYNVAARTFCTPRRGYLIQIPVYNEFHETRKKAGVPQVEAPLVKILEGNRIRYEVDFDSFERRVKKADVFLLSNPHNPVGRVYSCAELKRMAEICIERDVLIVSDEIHSELLLGGIRFWPIATLSRAIANRTITLVSASKTFNVPGLFCAFAIIPNKELRRRYKETVYRLGMHVASPGLIAARIAYSGQCDAWLRDLRKYLTANRDFLIAYVSDHMPAVRITMPRATYLAWLDFSQLKLELSPYEFFLQKAKIALSDGALFGENGKGHARLNFGTSRRTLQEGLERMDRALRSR